MNGRPISLGPFRLLAEEWLLLAGDGPMRLGLFRNSLFQSRRPLPAQRQRSTKRHAILWRSVANRSTSRDFVAWTRHGCRSIGDAPHRKVHSPPGAALPLPFKYHAEQRHHIPKPRYRVTNWAEYDASLKRRGSLTVWFTDEAIQAWRAEPRITPGGQPHCHVRFQGIRTQKSHPVLFLPVGFSDAGMHGRGRALSDG